MDPIAAAFEELRGRLFGIAYRMLGSVMEAEDIVQEAWLRFQRAAPSGEIQSPRAWLGSVVTRLCLDQMKSAAARRESYIGPWLPEPLHTEDTPEATAETADSLSMAFLVLLENLTPVERAVFLLREVFDYDYAEIAQWIDKSEVACRQIFSRARHYISAHRPRFSAAPEEQAQIFSAFLSAVQLGNLDALKLLLATDASAWSDGGGKASAATRPLHGADAIARFMIGIFRQAPADVTYEVGPMNHAISLIARDPQGSVEVVIIPEISDGCIQVLRFIRNPDKLRHV